MVPGVYISKGLPLSCSGQLENAHHLFVSHFLFLSSEDFLSKNNSQVTFSGPVRQ